jgi:hypothetical protein
MHNLTILLTMFIVGILVKIVDMVEDDGLGLHKIINIIFGVVYGFFIALLINNVPLIAPLLLGTVIGVILSGRIDGHGHYFGIGSFVFFLFFLGVPEISIPFLLLFTLVCVFEEAINMLVDNNKIKNKLIKKTFKLRPLLEITALLVSVFTGFWLIWFSILIFDIGYLSTKTILQKYKKILNVTN